MFFVNSHHTLRNLISRKHGCYQRCFRGSKFIDYSLCMAYKNRHGKRSKFAACGVGQFKRIILLGKMTSLFLRLQSSLCLSLEELDSENTADTNNDVFIARTVW